MTFTKAGLIAKLKGYNSEKVEQFAGYCCRLALEKDKDTGKLKNEWITKYDDEKLATFFKRVALDEGLFLDGVNITLTNRGIQYDYKAYKNKILLVYPESQIDNQLVYKGDTFSFKKESGKVIYTHNIANPFEHKDDDIIGGYCVIKNRRGEFLVTLGKEELEKHRKLAKTDKIWKTWFKEMCLKTVIRKACSFHFSDIVTNMEQIDNEANYNIDNPVSLSIDDKAKIDEIQTLVDLRKFYSQNKDKFNKNSALLKYIQEKQAELKKQQEGVKA